jgi:hypothetical protein
VQGLSLPADNSEKIYCPSLTARILTKTLAVNDGRTAQNSFYPNILIKKERRKG